MTHSAGEVGSRYAWVVSWQTEDGVAHEVGRAFRDRAKAESQAATLKASLPQATTSVDRLPDLNVDEVWPRFVEMVGKEVAPGVLQVDRGWGDLVTVSVSPETVLTRAFVQMDYGDDSDLAVIPEAVHPYRLGLAMLVEQLDQELQQLPDGVRDLRL